MNIRLKVKPRIIYRRGYWDVDANGSRDSDLLMACINWCMRQNGIISA